MSVKHIILFINKIRTSLLYIMPVPTWKKKFFILWGGQFFSLISSSAVNFAIIIWLSLKTGSSEVLTYAAIASLLPQGLIGPFAGVFIDRWNRRLTMMLSDGFVAFCTLIMCVSFYVGYENLLLIYTVLTFRSIGSAFHMPAMQASIPLMAPKSELLRIAGINQIIRSMSNIAGPALGALAIGFMPIGHVLLFDIAGAIIAIVSLLFIAIPTVDDKEKPNLRAKQVLREMVVAYQEVRKSKGLTLLFLYCAIVGICIMPISVLLPLMTMQQFNGGKFEMGVVEVLWGSGAFVGGALLSIWKIGVRKVYLVSFAHVLIGFAFLASAFLAEDQFILFVLLMSMGGVSAAFYNSGFTASVQEVVKPHLLGRVFSLYYSLDVLPTVFALIGTGFLVDHIGLDIVFGVFGTLVLGIGILSFLTPAFRTMS